MANGYENCSKSRPCEVPSGKGSIDPTRCRGGRRLLAAMAILVTISCWAAVACSSSSSSKDSAAQTGSTLAGTNTTERPAGKPKPGGQLTMGLANETNDFNPAVGQWSPSSYSVANALLDPMVALDDKGIAHPFLVETITANADFTEWVFTTRPGITFHDGTPVDAAAIKRNLDNVRSSALTGKAFSAVTSIEVSSERRIVIKMDRSWATFPATLSTQAGYVLAPSMLDDPAGAGAKIVGSGPFTFVDRQRDAFVKTRKNAKYWQKDADGVPLPYIDGLDFRVMTDSSARKSSLAAGDINAMLVVATSEVLNSTAQEASRQEVQRLADDRTETDEVILAFNTTKEPFDDPVARQAIAYATDQNQLADSAFRGAMPGAWGMFSEGSPYYISPKEAGYPGRDLDKAKALAAEYQQKTGRPIQFTALVGPDTDAVAAMQAIQAALADANIKMEISAVETTQLITRVIVSGDYQAAYFVLWSSPTPDQGYVFIATPPNSNGISLNFSRYDDPALTAALDEFRATSDARKRIDAMTKVQQQLAKNLQVVFLAHQRSAFVYANDVHGFTSTVFPGTQVSAFNPYPVTPFFTSAWKG